MLFPLRIRIAAFALIALPIAAPWLRAQPMRVPAMGGLPTSKPPRPRAAAAKTAYKPTEEQRIVNLLRPARIDDAELSPDGRHLAYAAYDSDRLHLFLVDLDHPESSTSVEVGQGDLWHRLTTLSGSPPPVTFLHWATARRLIFTEDTNVYAINADGGKLTTLVTGADVAVPITTYQAPKAAYEPAGTPDVPVSTDLQPRVPRVAATPPEDPEHVIVEASGPQDPVTGLYSYGLYRVDIESGTRVSLGEAQLPGQQLIYDRAGHLRIVLASLRHTYLHAFPSSSLWRGAKPLDAVVHEPADRGFQAAPETFLGAHSFPIGFDYDSTILYYGSNRSRDLLGVYALDLTTGKRTSFAVESPDFDVLAPSSTGDLPVPGGSADPLVFDAYRRQLVGVRLAGPKPATRWLDAPLAQIQTRLEQKFPELSVTLLQWDEYRARFLALVTGTSDPGRYYLYTPANDQIMLCARRAPWTPGEVTSTVIPLAFTAADGTPLTGSLTMAKSARINPPPLVVLCPDGPGQAFAPEFDGQAQAFAGMGFVILRVNYRGSGGLGLKHLEAIRGGIDRIPLDDILAAIDFIRLRVPIDPKRIAVVGEGFGGYLALRAVQVHPERFRCAVSIGGPVDMRQWVQEPDLIAGAQTLQDDGTAFQTIIANAASATDKPRYAGTGPTNQKAALNNLAGVMGSHAENLMTQDALPPEDPPELLTAKARLALLGDHRPDLAAISPVNFPQDLIRPMLMIQDSTANAAYLASVQTLRRAVEKHGGQVDFLSVDEPVATMDPRDHAKVLVHIEDFLNLDFYSYNVEIGELKTKD